MMNASNVHSRFVVTPVALAGVLWPAAAEAHLVLAAFDWRLSPGVIRALAAAVGLLHGWLNGAGIAAEGREVLGVVGIASAVFVLAALSTARVVSLSAPWTRVIVRVAGSWVAATGVLMLGWGLRGV